MQSHEGFLPEAIIEKQKKAPFLILDDGTVIEQRQFSGGENNGTSVVGSIVVKSIDIVE
jgi:hypothetical protein